MLNCSNDRQKFQKLEYSQIYLFLPFVQKTTGLLQKTRGLRAFARFPFVVSELKISIF